MWCLIFISFLRVHPNAFVYRIGKLKNKTLVKHGSRGDDLGVLAGTCSFDIPVVLIFSSLYPPWKR